MYAAIVRAAPAPYALDMLTRSQFDRGEYAQASMTALKLPRGDQRSEWLARIAQARGDRQAALASYLRAGDAEQVQARIGELASRNLRGAILLERELIGRMSRDRDHPDAVADATWSMGVLVERGGDKQGALRLYRRASQISPINAKYLLSAASAERGLGMTQAARADMLRAHDVDPRLTP